MASGQKALARLLVGCLACTAGVLASPRAARALPSGWGYELVSPTDSLGADIDYAAGSADGNHAWVSVLLPITTDSPSGNLSTLEAVRTASGWTLRDLADSSAPNNDTAVLMARSADSSHTIVQRCPALLTACDQYIRYERIGSDGSRSLLLNIAPFQLVDPGPQPVAASDDASALFLQTPSSLALLPEDTHTQGAGLYVTRNGTLEYLGYDESGTVLDCGTVLGDSMTGGGFEQNGISADGATVFFESPDRNSGCPDPTDVYVRRAGQSVNISAPRNGNPDAGSTYLGNSRDGNSVYFLTESQLVASDTDAFADIYEYDVPTDTVTRITPGSDVRQAVVSPQGDYVYFKALNSINGQGTDGLRNLYVYHAGEFQLIVTANDGGNFSLGGGMSNIFTASPLTPDGKHLFFRGNSELTGQPLGGTQQYFHYDLPTNTLACISCPADGSAPSVDVAFPIENPTANADQRMQSDDGRTVVFQTLNRLLPQDINDFLDVYMWRDGVLSLISTGRSPRDSIIVSTDAAGHNVFFTSADRLVPQVDQDNSKLYDARLGGGFPFNPPNPACTDDSCQPALTDNPSYTPGGSETFTGPGDTNQHAKRSAHLAVVRLTLGARRQLLHAGQVTLKVQANKRGKVHVRVTITAHGHRVTLATVTRTAHKAGTMRIRIHLDRGARAALHGGAAVRFAITLGGHTVSRVAKLPK